MKKVGELTPREREAFDRLSVCKQAVEQVVHSAIREWETAMLSEKEVWEEIAKRYQLLIPMRAYRLDGSDIMEFEPTDPDPRSEQAKTYAAAILGKQGD